MNKNDAEALVKICHAIHSKGLVSGSGGNVSIRTEEGILITPSGIALEAVSLENLVKVDFDGNYSGLYKPSKEFPLHMKCYAARPRIRAVVHVHSVYSVALSCTNDIDYKDVVPTYTPGFAIRVGHLPVIPYYHPGSSELADAVSRVISYRNSVLMKNHGLVAVGVNLEAALNLAEEIEENAKIHFILAGTGSHLSGAQIDELYTFTE